MRFNAFTLDAKIPRNQTKASFGFSARGDLPFAICGPFEEITSAILIQFRNVRT